MDREDWCAVLDVLAAGDFFNAGSMLWMWDRYPRHRRLSPESRARYNQLIRVERDAVRTLKRRLGLDAER
jgi:hypothetical protein